MNIDKVGMYSTDEILEFMTEGEGRGFLGRSMFDAMYFEIDRLNNITKDIETYIHLWNIEEIGEKTMLILNDILLIKNGMSDEVIRLKGSDKVE